MRNLQTDGGVTRKKVLSVVMVVRSGIRGYDGAFRRKANWHPASHSYGPSPESQPGAQLRKQLVICTPPMLHEQLDECARHTAWHAATSTVKLATMQPIWHEGSPSLLLLPTQQLGGICRHTSP